MKTLLLITVLFGCVAFRSFAQEPVPLEVWTSVKGSLDAFEFPLGISGGMSYIPNFKNGAIPHAFIVNYRPFDATFEQRDGKVFTWGFSHPTDTINRYTWAGKNFIPIFTPDINGDGFRDFMNKDHLYYLGTPNDEPDTAAQYKVDGSIAKIDKFNNDNSDDFFFYGSGKMPNPYIVHFTFSNPTLKNFKKYSVLSKNVLQDSMSEEIAKAIYKNKQGKWRLLTYCRGWIDGVYTNVTVAEKSSIRLYALEFNKVTEDSTAVEAIQIDEYKDPKWLEYEEDIYTKDMIQWKPLNDQRLLYTTENHPRIFLYASLNTVPDKGAKDYNSYGALIDLSDDKIVFQNGVVDETITACRILKHSINGDSVEDLVIQLADWKVHFYAVSQSGIIKEIMSFDTEKVLKEGYLTNITSINDVSGDSIPDIACLFSNTSIGNAFIIAKGKDIVSTISENTQINFSLDTPFPLPNNTEIVIPLACKVEGSYSLYLYDIKGIKHSIFERKFLNEGRVSYPYPTKHLPNGVYVIRFTDGKQTVEKSILIQH